MIKHTVAHYIEENSLFSLRDKILVALSGGADSVALLLLLHNMGYKCEAAHCNFHLRGEESDRDERFVRSLTSRLDVKLHVVHFDTEEYAARKGVSIEMAARELRYEWFEKTRQESESDVIAVAHHRDDSVETLLLNLVRGTGINGLRGIQARNGYVVRPLLEVSRKDIVEYLDACGEEYVTDSTNLQDEYMRNKIRLNVMPLLETINPSVSVAIAETSKRLIGVADVYRKSINESVQRVVYGTRIDISALKREVAPENVLYEILYPLGFNPSQIKDVYRCLDKESGRVFLSAEYTLLLDHGTLVWRKSEEKEEERILIVEEVDMQKEDTIPSDRRMAYIDADKVQLPLSIRKWKSGDKFIPLGMRGFKKVRDYLRDRKYSMFDKERQMVLCSGDDIVWLVDERLDNRFKVTPDTCRVIRVRME